MIGSIARIVGGIALTGLGVLVVVVTAGIAGRRVEEAVTGLGERKAA